MSEMTATRMRRAHSLARGVVLAAAIAGWVVAALALWRTSVPSGLDVSGLDPHRYFSPAELARTARYERFLRIDWALATLAELGVLVFVAVRGPRLAAGIRLGRVGGGIVVGLVALTAVAFVSLPFSVAAQWWQRHHGVERGGWAAWLTDPWVQLLGTTWVALLVIALVMALAARFPRRWWIAAAPALTAIALLFVFVAGALAAVGTHSLDTARLRADKRQLERRTGTEGTPVEIQRVSDTTRQANAMAIGLGPSQRVILWDTLLKPPFDPAEVRVVLAHELGHVARDHLWKGVAWFGLSALPGAYLIAVATRRRGGPAQAAAIPLAFLTLVVLQLVFLPLTNEISRRYEAEADWVALRTTRDPDAARRLFAQFSKTSLIQPDPPTWSYVLLDDHPTVMQRIAMATRFAGERP